jgi:hypothetical protein
MFMWPRLRRGDLEEEFKLQGHYRHTRKPGELGQVRLIYGGIPRARRRSTAISSKIYVQTYNIHARAAIAVDDLAPGRRFWPNRMATSIHGSKLGAIGVGD